MADKNKIKERLKALYPGVNLSKERIEQISSRLAPKAADDAEDAAIDELLNNANDFMPFADIAKEDDRVRTLLANQKPTPPPATPPATPADFPDSPPKKDDETPAWAKALIQEVQTLKLEKQQKTKREKAASLVPNASEALLDLLVSSMPEAEEELTGWAEKANSGLTATRQTEANNNRGPGLPPLPPKTGNTKSDPKKVEGILNEIM